MDTTADKMAALKARVAAAIGSSKARGGLNVGLHPALEELGQWKPPGKLDAKNTVAHAAQDSSRQARQGSKALPTEASDRHHNPYLDGGGGSQAAVGKQRQSRQLIFNYKGKYIQQANALRRQAALDALKKRIAEQTRKSGIDEDLDVEKNFVVEDPPDIEWWDSSLVNGTSYDNIDDVESLCITTPDSIVTELIQHPVAIEPPQDQHVPAPKPMYLTTKEQKKLRRQRRMADLKEMQAKIRLGLVSAPPQKVKKANLMRVLGNEALSDPTAVEARVDREIRERYQKHMETNEERKLTKDQRHEKLVANQEKDAAKGIHLLVLKIGSLANGQHRYKVNINAEQLSITGTCIMHPKLNLIIAEGGAYSIRKYKKLLMNRIDWTENAPSRERDGAHAAVREWLLAEDEKGTLKDMSMNECKLVFEGEEKARAFRKWSSRVCETDSEAREVLARAKMDNFWSLAKGI